MNVPSAPLSMTMNKANQAMTNFAGKILLPLFAQGSYLGWYVGLAQAMLIDATGRAALRSSPQMTAWGLKWRGYFDKCRTTVT
jgi:hypothetical protein